MPALAAGTLAPDFILTGLDGQKFSLQEGLQRGPVIVAFFKVSCPTCQYAFPFLQRLYKAYENKPVTVIGISQNDRKQTASFIREFGITFPILLDDIQSYPVSNAYGLTNVPSIFWIGKDGEIELSTVGWVKADFEAMNRRLAESVQSAEIPLFNPEEDVRDFRAG